MSISDERAGGRAGNDHMTQLESKLAFLEHTVDVLAAELEAQQNETRTLNKKLQGLQQQVESQQRDTGIDEPQNELPPHY